MLIQYDKYQYIQFYINLAKLKIVWLNLTLLLTFLKAIAGGFANQLRNESNQLGQASHIKLFVLSVTGIRKLGCIFFTPLRWMSIQKTFYNYKWKNLSIHFHTQPCSYNSIADWWVTASSKVPKEQRRDFNKVSMLNIYRKWKL